MTIEEKAKAYDEALEKVKPLYEQAKRDSNPIWSTYEYLIPELAENEDEKVRKALIEGVRQIRCKGDVTQEQMIAYLKQKDNQYFIGYAKGYSDGQLNPKQKEESFRDFIEDFPYSAQKEQNEESSKSELKTPEWVHKGWDDEYMINTVIGRYSLHAEVAKKRGDTHDYNLSKSMENWLRNVVKPLILEKQKDKMTAEEHEIVKVNINGIHGLFPPVGDGKYIDEHVTLDKTAEEKQKEQNDTPLMNGDADLYFDNWIQHNDTTKRGCFEEGIRYAQRLQKEQKPAEWSEEDEKTIDDAFCWLCEYAGSLIQRNYGKSSMLYGIANKLKSLRPQYHGDVTMTEAYKMGKEAGEASHWKPTEHQMTILKAVKEYVGKGSGYWGEGLGSLIDDLEKL